MTPENEKSIRQLEKLTCDVDVCRKYVQLKDAVKIYGASATFISRRAKKAGAAYKVGSMLLINIQKFEEYLEKFHVEGEEDNK